MKRSLSLCLIAPIMFMMMASCGKSNLKTKTIIDSLKIGLIAYYPLKNSAADISGNNHNGTAHNVTPTTDRFGNANSAYLFNGDSTSYISIPDAQALRLAGTDFTINVWVNMTAYNSSVGSHILSKRSGDVASGYTYSLDGYGATGYPLGVQGFGAGGGAANAIGNSGTSLNQWHMVTVVYTTNNSTLTFYKDGVFDGATSGITPPLATNAATMYIGKDNPLQPTTYYFKGAMSDLFIYSRKITSVEAAKLYILTNAWTPTAED